LILPSNSPTVRWLSPTEISTGHNSTIPIDDFKLRFGHGYTDAAQRDTTPGFTNALGPTVEKVGDAAGARYSSSIAGTLQRALELLS
jgi:hypothetical protein